MQGKRCIEGIGPEGWVRSPLHDAARDWPETNCYTDVWIEILHAMGCEPAAGLGFTVAQDFEGDHFTFFKFPPEDLEALYGLKVSELAIYDSVEAQVLEQIERGRLSLVEADSFYLPDTAGVSYKREHTKSTIAINRLDVAGKRMDYFHGAGFHRCDGEDYEGALGQLASQAGMLFPYVEFVKIGPRRADVPGTAIALLSKHLAERPARNPVAAFRDRIAAQIAAVAAREPDFFHRYAFNTLRQIGANFELLASHVEWLGSVGEAGLEPSAEAARRLSAEAKIMQFQLARAVARRKVEGLEQKLDPMIEAYERAVEPLGARYG